MKLFSDCSGPCETCANNKPGVNCLAGHGDDHYVENEMPNTRNRANLKAQIDLLSDGHQGGMMKLDIVKFNPEGDGVTAMYINGDLHTSGDYYHNNIDAWTQGFCEGLDYATAEYNLERWEIPGDTDISKDVCELGYCPPRAFSELNPEEMEKSV